jgi:ABC-type multidrug transport system ATPase subunit
MLELREIAVTAGDGENAPTLLTGVSARFPRGEVCALLGPSGSGKTTLVRAVAGIAATGPGSMHWEGLDLEVEDLPPSQIGYVPQFTISQENLTARENVMLAIRLRVAGVRGTDLGNTLQATLRRPAPATGPRHGARQRATPAPLR